MKPRRSGTVHFLARFWLYCCIRCGVGLVAHAGLAPSSRRPHVVSMNCTILVKLQLYRIQIVEPDQGSDQGR